MTSDPTSADPTSPDSDRADAPRAACGCPDFSLSRRRLLALHGRCAGSRDRATTLLYVHETSRVSGRRCLHRRSERTYRPGAPMRPGPAGAEPAVVTAPANATWLASACGSKKRPTISIVSPVNAEAGTSRTITGVVSAGTSATSTGAELPSLPAASRAVAVSSNEQGEIMRSVGVEIDRSASQAPSHLPARQLHAMRVVGRRHFGELEASQERTDSTASAPPPRPANAAAK